MRLGIYQKEIRGGYGVGIWGRGGVSIRVNKNM